MGDVMSVEILAPVGGAQQLIAAVRSGADAVYLGTKNFNARRNAENFDAEMLKDTVSYCHGRGVKVHIAFNTLVKDTELRAVYDEIEMLAECGVDAVIVQDLAIAEMFRRQCPSMPLHASTQMTIHNVEGVLAAEELGFSRVVLARELTLEEIKKICSASAIEIEVFIHGALCMSVSGACYFSSILGERSGNRGLCAQPCRLDFNSGKREYALSLKDMSHISHIGELAAAGVSSLKIEGRMKRPEYVSAAVIACREALAGKTPDLTNLRAVFSRSGFTDGYLTGKRDLQMFGHRTKEDVAASGTVLGEIASGYRNELSRVPVQMDLIIAENKKSVLTVTDGVFTASAEGEIPEKARTKGTDYETALSSLSKTGGTPFVLKTLTATLDASLILPQGKLNSLRKEALEKLLQMRSEIRAAQFARSFSQPSPGVHEGEAKIRVRLGGRDQYFDELCKAERIYVPFSEIDANLISKLGDKLICEMPRLIFPMKESALEEELAQLKKLGVSRVCAGNIGSVRMALRLGFRVHGGFDLNILNSESLIKYEEMGLKDTLLSYEIGLRDAAALGGEIERGIIGYGYLPLMIFRNCPAKAEKGCGKCNGQAEIFDRTGANFGIVCSSREYSSLHNHVPLYLGDKKISATDFAVLYFTHEDRTECQRIWAEYLSGEPYNGRYTRGLYYRKLL